MKKKLIRNIVIAVFIGSIFYGFMGNGDHYGNFHIRVLKTYLVLALNCYYQGLSMFFIRMYII